MDVAGTNRVTTFAVAASVGSAAATATATKGSARCWILHGCVKWEWLYRLDLVRVYLLVCRGFLSNSID